MNALSMQHFWKLVTLVVTVTVSTVGQADESSTWIALFDSTSLAAWRGYQTDALPEGWVVEEGVLKHQSGEVDLMTKEEFADFDLEFEWRIAPNGNSGVIYRCDESESASYMTGPEYQLVDNASWQLDSRDPHASGALYGLYPDTQSADRPAGEWNTGRIVVRGNHVEHWLNGQQVVSAEIGSPQWKDKVADTKFANWKRFGTLSKGHIALQAHRGQGGKVEPVWFRNIRIRRLTDSE